MQINSIALVNHTVSPFFSGNKNISIITSSKPDELQENTLDRLKLKPTDTTVKKFKNGEIYVNINDDVRDKDVFIMPPNSENINDDLMETYLKADAAKRSGAEHVYAVMPNLPYARQERRCKNGEPISAKLNIDLLKTSGVDGIITVDLHSPAIEGFANNKTKVEHVHSLSAFADYYKAKNIENMVVVSPDVGGIKRADELAKELDCKSAAIYKQRAAHNEAQAVALIGDVRDKNCIIYDDMIDTAGTISEAARILKENGAKDIYAAAAHGLFNEPAAKRLNIAPIKEIAVTNTVPLKENRPRNTVQIDSSKAIAGAILDITG